MFMNFLADLPIYDDLSGEFHERRLFPLIFFYPVVVTYLWKESFVQDNALRGWISPSDVCHDHTFYREYGKGGYEFQKRESFFLLMENSDQKIEGNAITPKHYEEKCFT